MERWNFFFLHHQARMSLAPPFPVKINIKGAEDVVCVRRTYEEALERCASNLGVSASQVELKIASHGQLFSIDPRDWSKLEPTDQLHALKKSKGKQPVRGDVSDSNPVVNTTSTSAKRKVESVEISSGSSDEDETSTSTIDRSNSGSRKAIGVKDRERKRSKKDKVPIQTTSTSTSSLNRHNTPPPPSRIPSTSTRPKVSGNSHSTNQVPYRSGSSSSSGHSKSNTNKDVNKAMGKLTVRNSSGKRWQEADSKLLMRYIAMEFRQLERPLNPGHRDLVFENICRKHSGPGGDLYGRSAESLANHAKEQFKTNTYQAPFTADLEAIFSRKTKSNSGPSQPMLEQDYFVPSPIKKPTKSSTSSSSSSSKLQSGKHQGTLNVLPRKVPHIQPHSQRPSNSTSTSAPTRVVSNSSSNSNSNSNRRRREDAESSSSEEESSSDSSDSDEDSDDSRDLACVDDRETTSASSHPQNEPGPPPKPPSSISTSTQNRNTSHPNMTSNSNQNQCSNNNPNLNSSSNSRPRQPPPPSIEPSFSPPPPPPPPSVPRAASLAIKEDEEVDELLYDRDEPDPIRPVPSRSDSRNLPIWAQSRRSSVVGGEDIKPDVVSLDNREGRHQDQNQSNPSTSTSTNVNRNPNSFNNNLPPPPPPKVSGTNSIPINATGIPLGPRAMQMQGQNQSPAHHSNLSSSSPMVHRPLFSPTYGGSPYTNPSNYVQGAMDDQAGPSNYMNQQQLHQPQQQPQQQQVQPTEIPMIEVVIHHLPLGHDQDWINWLLGPFKTVEIKERIGTKSQLPFLIVKFESLDQAKLAIQSLNGTQHGQGENLRFLKLELSHQSAAKLKGMGLM